MQSMIEKVTEAMMECERKRILENKNETLGEVYVRLARAAIKAMREPNEAMLAAGDSSLYYTTNLYQSMIDAALKE